MIGFEDRHLTRLEHTFKHIRRLLILNLHAFKSFKRIKITWHSKKYNDA